MNTPEGGEYVLNGPLSEHHLVKENWDKYFVQRIRNMFPGIYITLCCVSEDAPKVLHYCKDKDILVRIIHEEADTKSGTQGICIVLNPEKFTYDMLVNLGMRTRWMFTALRINQN